MNRLTHWNGKKWILPQGAWREIAERLAAYENTGLTPEQINSFIAGGSTPNLIIRQLLLQNGLKHWQVAKEIGITPYTFSVWMREDLSEERLKRVKEAINTLTGVTNQINDRRQSE